MNRERVDSKNIRSVGYEEKKKILELEFNTGGIYRYLNVPVEVFKALMEAVSKGSYFHEKIRGRYRFQRLR